MSLNGLAQKSINDWKYLDLKGKVQELQEESFEIKKENDSIIKINIDKRPFTNNKAIRYFNENGYLLKEFVYTHNDDLIYNHFFEYLNKQYLIRRYSTDLSNKVIHQIIYKYDTLSRKINDYELNENFDTIHKNEYRNDDDTLTKLRISYDYRYNSKSIITLKYDISNNLIESKSYNEGSKNFGFIRFSKYDSLNRETEQTNFYKSLDNFAYKSNYKYDNNSNLIQITHIKKVDLDKKNQMEIIEDGFYTDYTLKYKYTFDLVGNWITRIEYKNEIPIKLIERKIVYFD